MKVPTIDEIQNKAQQLGITISSLCDQAKVHPSTFYRWREGKHPVVSTVERLVAVLNEAQLHPKPRTRKK